MSPSSSASPLELYPSVHYLREEVQDMNSLWWIRFALGSLSQKEKQQLQEESDAKRLALAGETHRVWCAHPILSDGNSACPLSIIMGYDGVCTFPEACPSHHCSCQFRFTVIQYMDLVMPAWQQRARKVGWQLILDWSKFVESILVGSKGIHFYGGKVQWSEVKVAQSCPTLCNPMDYGVLQARILEWVAFPSPGDLPNPGIEPRSPTLQVDSLRAEPPGKPNDDGKIFKVPLIGFYDPAIGDGQSNRKL